MVVLDEVQAVYEGLKATGHVLTTDSHTLNVSRGSELTPEEQATIREHKPAIMLLVLCEEAQALSDWLWAQEQRKRQSTDYAGRLARWETVIAMLNSLGWRESAA